jgi:hypothetical protein
LTVVRWITRDTLNNQAAKLAKFDDATALGDMAAWLLEAQQNAVRSRDKCSSTSDRRAYDIVAWVLRDAADHALQLLRSNATTP